MTMRRGFSLIEVMVSLTLLAIVVMSLARVSTVISIRARSTDVVAKRMAVLQMEANKFGAMPYDSVVTYYTSSQTRTRGGFTYKRTRTYTVHGRNEYTIKPVCPQDRP